VCVCVCVCVLLQVLKSDQPCHMYFDVEFSRAANPHIQGSRLVCVLIEAVRRLFR